MPISSQKKPADKPSTLRDLLSQSVFLLFPTSPIVMFVYFLEDSLLIAYAHAVIALPPREKKV